MNTRLGIGLGLGIVVVLVGVIALILTSQVQDASAREHRIIIPEGTGDLIAQGKDPAIFPDELRLEVGDILVVENRDITGHQIGDLWIGAGETLRQQFREAGVYLGNCTAHKDSQIQIIIEAKG
jgi:plastocyanin